MILICGGCDKNGKPKDTRTMAQKYALEKFLKLKRMEYPKAIIQGHRDFPNVSKSCPCFDARAEYQHI